MDDKDKKQPWPWPKWSTFTEAEREEIEAAMNQSDEEKEAGLDYLKYKWIDNRVNEFRGQAQKADSIKKIEQVEANVGRLIDYYTRIKAKAELKKMKHFSKATHIKTLSLALEELSGILTMIKSRKPHLKNKPPAKEKPKTFVEFLNTDNPKVISEKIKRDIQGSAINYAAFYFALKESGLIKSGIPKSKIFVALRDFFGNSMGIQSGFYSYLNENNTKHNNLLTSGLINDYHKWIKSNWI